MSVHRVEYMCVCVWHVSVCSMLELMQATEYLTGKTQ